MEGFSGRMPRYVPPAIMRVPDSIHGTRFVRASPYDKVTLIVLFASNGATLTQIRASSSSFGRTLVLLKMLRDVDQ
jgi:hypothetical protein